MISRTLTGSCGDSNKGGRYEGMEEHRVLCCDRPCLSDRVAGVDGPPGPEVDRGRLQRDRHSPAAGDDNAGRQAGVTRLGWLVAAILAAILGVVFYYACDILRR